MAIQSQRANILYSQHLSTVSRSGSQLWLKVLRNRSSKSPNEASSIKIATKNNGDSVFFGGSIVANALIGPSIDILGPKIELRGASITAIETQSGSIGAIINIANTHKAFKGIDDIAISNTSIKVAADNPGFLKVESTRNITIDASSVISLSGDSIAG